MNNAIDQQYGFPGFTNNSVNDGGAHFQVRMANSDLDPHAVARVAEERIIADAIAIIDRRFKRGEVLSSPRDSADYFKLKLAGLPYEVFGCLYLDNRHACIAFEELFRGTIDGANVHPREVVRACMQHNAVAVIFGHNHPSGNCEPSLADRKITGELRDALKLIGVRVLDHLVVGSGEPVSMAARGLI